MLWAHQHKIIQHANAVRKSVIYADMGTGKTLAALRWLEQFNGPCLVLCPKAALHVWREDAERFATRHVAPLVRGTSTSKTRDMLDAAEQGHVVVVNYETARLLPLERVAWHAVVADECQRLGTHNSKQTLALTRKLASVPHKVAMTGTLWHDSPAKLYSIMRWLYPFVTSNRAHPKTRTWGTYNDYLQRFAKTYEISRGIYGVAYWHGLDQIAADVNPFVLQIKADDVLDLPPVVERTHIVTMTGDVKRVYAELAKERIATHGDLTALAPHELTKLTRLAQLANNGTMVADDGHEHVLTGLEQRYAVFDELISSLGSAPVVVFTRWRKDVEQLAERLGSVSYLTGDKNTLATWQAGKTQVLLANLAAGSEAVRLERAAHIIFWSVGYSAGQYAQAVARCRRAGQKAGTVYVSHIVTQGSTDAHIYAALRGKDKVREKLDGATT